MRVAVRVRRVAVRVRRLVAEVRAKRVVEAHVRAALDVHGVVAGRGVVAAHAAVAEDEAARVVTTIVPVEPMVRLLERLELRVAPEARLVEARLVALACFAAHGTLHGLGTLRGTLVQAA